ncbi:alpha/beta fold hydrolase [Clostridiaceae bacterium M8S5]|nr:alpha/beta fold hydrolase [Clostridiaceae bacterium M8S5]
MKTNIKNKINKKSKYKIFKIATSILGIIILISLVGFSSFIGISSADGLINYNKGNDTAGNSRKQLEIWGYDTKKFEKNYIVEKLTTKAEDDNIVPMYKYRSLKPDIKGTAILVHGFGGNYICVYPQVEMYIKEGFNVIAIDQRASGASTNDKLSFGYYEKLDIKAVVDYVKNNSKGKIVVHGFSMGAHTSGLYASTQHAKENIDTVVLDGPFDCMESMYLDVWNQMNTGLPGEYAVFCTNIALRLKYGFTFNDANVKIAVKDCEVPTLFIQSKKDTGSTVNMGESIFKNIKTKKKEYWEVNSKHIMGYIDFPKEYAKKVFNFIGR